MPVESAHPLPPREHEERFQRLVELGITHALAQIRHKFENPQDVKKRLPHHDVSHTKNVIHGTELLLRTIRQADPTLVSEREELLGKFAAAYHDIVQDWETDTYEEDGFMIIKREMLTGRNESESIQKATSYMDTVNRNEKIFTDPDKRIVSEAIETTEPQYDNQYKTFVQPNLKSSSSLVSRAVALADLGTAGLYEPPAILSAADSLFREINLDILDTISDWGKKSYREKDFFKSRALSWMSLEVDFIKGRDNLLEHELEGIPQQARDSVRSLFCYFDASQACVSKISKDRAKMSPKEVLVSMGYVFR